MKKSNIILVFTIITLCFISCVKDLGNYDYIKLEDFEITNFLEDYNVTPYEDNLKISPEIVSKSTDFEYLWYITNYDENDSSKENIDTLSREKVLDVPFEYTTGNYVVYYRVKNLETGISKYMKARVHATTEYMDAFYLLKQTSDGNTDMDIHYPSGEVDINVIKRFTGKSLLGAPKALTLMTFFSYLDTTTGEMKARYLVVPMSEKDMTSLRISDMQLARSNDEWFYAPYPVEKIKVFSPMNFGFIVVTEDGVHQNSQNPGWGTMSAGIFANEPNRTADDDASLYDVSSNVCFVSEITDSRWYPYQNGSAAYFHNKRNNQFICVDYTASPKNCKLMRGKEKVELEGRVVKIVSSTIKDGHVFIICEREDKTRYCYETVRKGYVALDIINQFELGTDSGFANADIISACRFGAHAIYGVENNEVSVFFPEEKKSQKLQFTDLPEGRITYFDTMFFRVDSDPESAFNYMIVGVEKDGRYQVAFYELVGALPEAGAKPVKILSGEGKVSSIQYMNPLKSSVTFDGLWSLHY